MPEYVIHYEVFSYSDPVSAGWRVTYTNRINLDKVAEYLRVIENDDGLNLLRVVMAP